MIIILFYFLQIKIRSLEGYGWITRGLVQLYFASYYYLH